MLLNRAVVAVVVTAAAEAVAVTAAVAVANVKCTRLPAPPAVSKPKCLSNRTVPSPFIVETATSPPTKGRY